MLGSQKEVCLKTPLFYHDRTSRRAESPLAGFTVLATIALGITVASPASAFDQDRRGFVLEYGLGPSYSTAIVKEYDPYFQATIEAGQMQFSAATRFRLGSGVSERVAIMYVNDLAFSLDDALFYEDAFTLNGLSGIGVRWYAKPTAPSWHVEGAVGLARTTLTSSSGSDATSDSGFGFEGGVGFEFARSWSASLVARRLSFGEGAVDRNAFDLVISHIVY